MKRFIVLVIVLLLVMLGISGALLSRMNAAAIDLEVMGQYGGASYAVAATEKFAYVGVGPRLAVVDVSIPSQPWMVGETEMMVGVVQDVALAGDYAYVAAATAGLVVVDVSQADRPVVVAQVAGEGFAEDVAVAGSLVYVAQTPVWSEEGWSGDGLLVVDVSNPAQPQIISAYDTPGYSHGVAVNGERVFVADGDGGLRILDGSDPKRLQELGMVYTSGYALDVAVSSDTAYVAGFDKGVMVVDVSKPEQPQEVGVHDTAGKARALLLAANHLYVADSEGGLHVWDIGDAKAPHEIGAFTPAGDVRGMALAGKQLYVADRANGLRVVDVTDAATPQEVGLLDTLGHVDGVAIGAGPDDGRQVYLASGGNVRVLDMSDLAAPHLLAFHPTPGRAQDVALAENALYVADAPIWRDWQWQGGGLRVLDVDKEGYLHEMAFFDTPGQATGVAVDKGLAYLADGNGGVRVYDVQDRGNAHEVEYAAVTGHVRDMAIANGQAYIATGGRGVAQGRADNLGAIRAEENAASVHHARGLSLAGSLLYVADMIETGDAILPGARWPQAGLKVVNPSSLDEMAAYHTPGDIQNVTVANGMAFVADGDGGLLLMKVSQ